MTYLQDFIKGFWDPSKISFSHLISFPFSFMLFFPEFYLKICIKSFKSGFAFKKVSFAQPRFEEEGGGRGLRFGLFLFVFFCTLFPPYAVQRKHLDRTPSFVISSLVDLSSNFLPQNLASEATPLSANVCLFIAVNLSGVYTKYLTDRTQRKAFLETRRAMETRFWTQKENEKQEKLLLSGNKGFSFLSCSSKTPFVFV